MIEGLYEAHLPVRDLGRSIQFYERLGLELDHRVEDLLIFFWIEKDKSWIGLWETERVELDYHPSIRHIAFHVSLENLKKSVQWLKARSMEKQEAFSFEPTEPFVMAVGLHAHAKIHFNDPDGNSLELICKLANPEKRSGRMYFREWEKQIEGK